MNPTEKFPFEAFLVDGRAVRVQGRMNNGLYLVELAYVDEEGEKYWDAIQTVERVFDKPPTEAYAQEIVELEANKQRLQDAIYELRAQETHVRKRIEALKKYDALQRVDDFLAGKITHYVIWSERAAVPVPRVSSVEAERCGDGNAHQPLKLLTLFGNAQRSLEWKLNHYSDGSGNYSNCLPCCSLEEAIEKARAIVVASLEKYKNEAQTNLRLAELLVQAAKAFDAPVPDGFIKLLNEQKIRGLQDKVKECETQRAQWQK